jgi:hypothetical protein
MAAAAIERASVLTILSIGDEQSIANNDVLERANRRELLVERLTFGEEGQIETGFHGEKSRATPSI